MIPPNRQNALKTIYYKTFTSLCFKIEKLKKQNQGRKSCKLCQKDKLKLPRINAIREIDKIFLSFQKK